MLLVALAATPAALVAQWTVSPQVQAAAPLGTMGDYFGRGAGFGMTLRSGPGPVRWRIQTSYTRFNPHTVIRGYNGNDNMPIFLTSGATLMTVVAGPEVAARVGRTRLAAGAGAGLVHVLASGSTRFTGDPPLVNRSNTFSSVTWAGQLYASVGRRVSPAADILVEGSVAQLGRTKFLREFNLPIGQISGMYLNPTPYAPRLASVSLSLRFAL